MIKFIQLTVRSIGILILTITFLSGCASFNKLSDRGVEMGQVPVTEMPSGEVLEGKIIWHDLITPDLKAAGAFYEKLFGWQIDYQGEYAVIRNGDKIIAGMLQVNPPEDETRDGLWIPSVSVADVDAAKERVLANGGKILIGPVDMGIRGRAMMISDSEQVDLILLTATGGDPADNKVAVGDWLWDEIWTDDPDKTQQFYQAVLGYDDEFLDDKYRILAREDQWRAGIRTTQSDSDSGGYKLWMPVIRVEDPVVSSAKVEELGGVVWVTPEESPEGGTALIADPTGALLMIQLWPNEIKGEN